jgi:Leucine-rich repeat (LRR) protein/tRNA A-37 threonylcarbamoyl transferase component Bud32
MGDLQAFLADYQAACVIPDLPESIGQYYNVNDCLKHNANQQVFLLKGKADGTYCILKVATAGSINKLMREHALFLKLHDSAFPHPITCFTRADHAFLLREYIPGKSLADYLESCEAIPVKRILSIACRVCEIVEKLHAMDPPIIHRDIKPQNIIISDSGTIHLVDLDTVQAESSEKSYDTEVLGTAATAAPEQFGYKRCDARADVYGIGMLLVFMLTGGYDVSHLHKLRVSPTLKRITYKCLRFDPEKRYPSVLILHKRLTAYTARWRNLAVRLVCAVLLCALAAGLYTNRAIILNTMETTIQQMNKGAYRFKSLLIERAVRLQLNRTEGDISIEDMQGITELNLMGDTPYLHWDDARSFGFAQHLYDKDFVGGYSVLADLTDLEYLPHLQKLSLLRLDLADLSPLSKLQLTHLSVCDNRISDISPLYGMKMLQDLDISNNPISDITGLAALTRLDTLNISSTLVTDLSPIAGMNLRALWLYVVPQNMDFTVLDTFARLEEFGSSDMPAEGVRNLLKVESLHNLLLFFSEVDSLEPFMKMKELNSLNLFGTQLTNLEGISAFKKLTYLEVTSNAIDDLSALYGNATIEKLKLSNNPVKDMSPLDHMSALKTVILSRGQETNFTRPISELPFAIEYYN